MRVDFYGLWLEFSDFNQLQLKEIERGRLNGLSIAQVQTYAYSACPFSKMSIIRGAFEEGLSFSEVSIFAHLEFCEEQMLVLKEGFQKGLNLDQMKLIAQPRYSALRMQILEEGMEFGELLLWNESFDALQLEQILEGRQNGLNHAQVKSYADPFFSNFQIQRLSHSPQACLWVNEYKKEYLRHKRGNSLIFLHEKSKMQFFYHTIPRTKNFWR